MKIDSGMTNMMNMAVTNGNKVNTENLKNKVDNANVSEDDKALREACNEFENYFLDQMMKEMRKTLSNSDEDNMIPKGQGEQIFTEMRDSEFSKKATKTGGIGLANLLFNQLKTNKKVISNGTNNDGTMGNPMDN